MEKHNYSIDKLRTIATCGVLMNHIALCNYKLYPIENEQMALFYYTLQAFSRFAVPLFILISGFLLLKKSYHYSFEKLYKQKIPRFLGCLFLYGSIFAWIELIFVQKNISFLQIPTAVWNTIQGKTWDHMWYMYMYLGLLIFYPVLRLFFIHAEQREKKWIILSGIFFGALVMTRHIGINYPLASIYPTLFLVGGGINEWYEKRTMAKNKVKQYAVFGIIFCSMVIIFLNYCAKTYVSEFTEALLEAPKLIMCTMAIFIFITVLLEEKNAKPFFMKMIQSISKYSFGIYIYHMFWINIIYKVLKINLFSRGFILSIVFYIFTWLAVLLLSLVSTAVTKKIPILKKLL